jgi:hypothetical protein
MLGSMLSRIYHNPKKYANHSCLQNILQFWDSREVYDNETMYSLAGAGPVKRIL